MSHLLIFASMSQLLVPCHSCWYFLASNLDLSAERRVVTGRSSKQSESRAEYANLPLENLLHFLGTLTEKLMILSASFERGRLTLSLNR